MKNLKQQAAEAGYSQPFTREKNNELYPHVVAGDLQARNDMIQGNMALVTVKVDAYLRTHPNMGFYRDDMTGAGLLALAEAVDSFMGNPSDDPNPTGYIYYTINRAIAEIADEEAAVSIPSRRQRELRAADIEFKLPRQLSESATTHVFAELEYSNGESQVDELQEFIESLCETDEDLTIVRMRARGSTNAEIAATIGLVEGSVQRRRERIYEKFLEHAPEWRELSERKSCAA